MKDGQLLRVPVIIMWLWPCFVTWISIWNVSAHEMVSAQQNECQPNQTVLRLLTSLPFPHPLPQFNPSWPEGPKILPVMYLAEEQINNLTKLLPCHKLELIIVDGGCDIAATTAVNTTIGLFNGSARVIGMVGPGCSTSSIQTAHVMKQPEIELVQVHGAGSYLLENRTVFPNSIGILGSTQSFVDLSLALMEESGWQNIAILYESNRVYYRSTKELFVESVKKNNVTILFDSPIYTTFYPLDGIRDSLARIVFVFTAPSHSMKIMCLAYHMGMVYPAYQWVIISRRRQDFIDEMASDTLSDNETYSFRYHHKDYSCSLGEILHVSLNKAFLLSYQITSLDTNKVKRNLTNITFNKFLNLYRERSNVALTYWAYCFYDAVWAWAFVLHRLIDKDNGIFDSFQYGNKTMANLILEEFYANDFEFEGMSGTISFNRSTGYNDRPSNLYQIINGEEIHVAYNNKTNNIVLLSNALDTILDAFRLVGLVSPIVISLFALLQLLLFFVTAFLHVLTVLYRDSKSVKASSPNLSHFAFTGTYLLLFGSMLFIFLNVREHPAKVSGPICHAVWAWFFPVGFTLVIGTVIVRTWRLYRIFVHYLDPGRFISNSALTTMLVVMVSVDVIIAFIWTAIDPRKLIMVERTVEIGSAQGLLIYRICRSQQQEGVWLVVVLSYKVAQLVVLVSLTLLTRRIPNKTFATTSLRIFTYIFSAVFGIGFAVYYCFLYFSRSTNPNIKTVILYFTLSSLLLLYILCVFSPPLTPVIHSKLWERKLKVSRISRKRKQCSDQVRARKTSEDALL